MPYFTPDDFDIDPSEFVSSCNSREINELIETLVEDGHIQPDQLTKNGSNGVKRPNLNDEIFWESLNHLAKCRDLLTTTEEEFINNLSKRFKHLR